MSGELKSAVSDRLAGIDYLRGVAVLGVVAVHVPHYAHGGWRENPLFFPAFLMQFGVLGVPLFIVISGFCIHRRAALDHLATGAYHLDWRAFWVRRFWRLYPPYVAAMVLGLFAAAALHGHYTLSSETLVDVSLHLLMLHNLTEFGASLGNGALWSLGMEEQLYALYAIALLPLIRWRWRWTLLLSALVAFVWRVLLFHRPDVALPGLGFDLGSWYFWPFGYWFHWTLGAYAVELSIRQVRPHRLYYSNALLIGLVGLAFVTSVRLHELLAETNALGPAIDALNGTLALRNELRRGANGTARRTDRVRGHLLLFPLPRARTGHSRAQGGHAARSDVVAEHARVLRGARARIAHRRAHLLPVRGTPLHGAAAGRIGGRDGGRCREGSDLLNPSGVPLRQALGCWLNERWRAELALRVPELVGSDWLDIRNRTERLRPDPISGGRSCLWDHSSALTVARVFPSFASRLLEHCLTRHPIRFERGERPMPSDAPDVSVLLAVGGVGRLQQFELVLASLRAQDHPDFEIVVVEQDSEPRLAERLPPDVRHCFTRGSADGFNKSWALNVGAAVARGRKLVVHDADYLAPVDYLRSIDGVLERVDGTRPGRFLFYADEPTTRACMARGKFPGQVGLEEVVQNNPTPVALTKDAYARIGGHDESFVGWGGEDVEFLDRLRTLDVSEGGFLPILHLWHPPAPKKASGDRNLSLHRQRLAESPRTRIERLTAQQHGLTTGPAE
jgi:peptidoglycan/LPS O-acetylase OafA/YrhL